MDVLLPYSTGSGDLEFVFCWLDEALLLVWRVVVDPVDGSFTAADRFLVGVLVMAAFFSCCLSCGFVGSSAFAFIFVLVNSG